VIAAATAQGLQIPADFAEYQIDRSWSMGPYRPSSLIDWELGRPVEVEAIWGEPLRRGSATGTLMPRLETLYALLTSVCTGQTARRSPSSN
jgi:2-dehydropantoate 2-reductase